MKGEIEIHKSCSLPTLGRRRVKSARRQERGPERGEKERQVKKERGRRYCDRVVRVTKNRSLQARGRRIQKYLPRRES